MSTSKYFGNKAFYKMVFAVALPIILQNGITTFVGLLDNIMVGQIGTEQMSGVAIVNQLVFVFNLGIFGIISGAGIFSSQYYGKGDFEGVRQTFRFKWIACTVFCAFATIVFIFLQEPLIKLYLNDGSLEGDLELTLKYAKEYFNIINLTLFPFIVSQIYGGTLREIEKTVLPMVSGFIAVFVNCAGNYLLIFGKLGFPVMGVEGAAIATFVSRIVEMLILVIFVGFSQEKYPFIKEAYKHFFKIEKSLIKNIFKKGTPLFLNEFFWAFGFSFLAQCYSVRGLSVVAAYNISSTVSNLFGVVYFALGVSVGIILGKNLGAKEFEQAEDTSRKLITFCVILSVGVGILTFLTSSAFPLLYNTSEEVRKIATSLLIVCAFMAPVNGFINSCYFTLRSGGKTGITFLFDSVFLCCVCVPVAFALVHYTTLPILPVYAITCSVDLIKCIIGTILLKKKVWINQLV